jgi:hypothetical protein
MGPCGSENFQMLLLPQFALDRYEKKVIQGIFLKLHLNIQLHLI